MGTGRREFTEEERAILKQNPYTYRVFKNSIRFTIEFKESFMRQYEAGMSPTKEVEFLKKIINADKPPKKGGQ